MAKFREGDKVRVVVTTIQRTNGAAWRDDRGEVKRIAGGKYVVEFAGGFRAENVAEQEIDRA